MRVAYVCADPGVPVFGRKGSSIHVQEVVRGLMRRAARVDLFAARTDGDPLPGASPASVHRLPAAEAAELAARERFLSESNVALRQVLEREGPFDLVYERHSLWSFAAMEYAAERRIPALLEVNAPLIEEQSSYRSLIDVEAARRATHRASGAASALLAVSETLAEYLEEQESSRGRVHVLTNGVDSERFNPGVPPVLPAEPGAFRVGFAGSLKAWHGLATLAEAFARVHGQHPSARLLIVGDGPERDRLTEQLRLLGVAEAACFTGTVDPAEMPGWLTSMDVAVAPYPPLERFYFSPLKVFEYMAAGLPVVASRVGQVAGLLEHGVTGLLCPAGDAGSLAGALSRLAEDSELRRRLGANARAAVSRDHTWEAVTERILQLASITQVPERAR